MKNNIIKTLGLIMTLTMLAGCGAQGDTQPEAAPETETVTETAQPTETTQETPADTAEESLVLSNGMISITMPEETKGLFISNVSDNSISVFDKEANEDGYGGFVFQVSSYKEPSEYAGGLDVKYGEFTASDGTLYDIVVTLPSDVQFNYEKYQDAAPESYTLLSNATMSVVENLTGADGSGTFVMGAGTKGEDLYGEVLQKHITAVREGWDANRLEAEDMSSMYFALTQYGEGDVMDRIGYAYTDINNDGIDELVIGEISDDEEWKGTIYDVYTMVDRKPAHVISGWDRSRYYVQEYGMLVNEYSGGALESGWNVYDIEPNTTNLFPQVFLKYDGYEDEENPWFLSYDGGETWEGMTEEEFEDRRSFIKYERFDFVPLSGVSADGSSSEDSEADYLGMLHDHKQAVSTDGCDTFTQMVDRTLADGQGYANEKLGDTDVLLVADTTFNGLGFDAALDSEIFRYTDDGSIEYLGFVQCGGTANPLVIKDGMIYTAGHHYVGKHTVTDGKLVTVEEAWQTFDPDGSVNAYHYNSDDGGDYSSMDSAQAEEHFNALFDEYLEGNEVQYSIVHR